MADDDPNIDPDSVAEETMVRARLAEAVELLPERERTIVRLYYMKSQSLKSIGARAGHLRVARIAAAAPRDPPPAHGADAGAAGRRVMTTNRTPRR